MSETLSLNPVMPVEDNTRIFDALRSRGAKVAAGVVLSAVALVSCSSDSNNPEASGNASPSAEATPPVAISELCAKKVNTAANLQDFGSPESQFSKLSVTETKDGKTKEVPLPTEKAEAKLINLVTNNDEALAVGYTIFVELRKTLQLPNAGTIMRVKENLETFRKDPKQLAVALNETCAALSMLELEKEFAVTRGQAMLVKANRTKDKNTYSTEVVNATENLIGFKPTYNKDDSELTDVQRRTYDKQNELILITLDGRLIVNMTFGPNSFEIDNNKVQTPVSIKVEGDKQILVKPTEKDGDVEAGSNKTTTKTNTGRSNTGSNGGTTSTGTNGGDAPTGTNGGTNTGENGCGTSGQPECGGGSGNDSGNNGPTGPGDGGNQSPATQEPAHQPQPQPTKEPESRPTPQPTPEQTPGSKGSEPPQNGGKCDPDFNPENC